MRFHVNDTTFPSEKERNCRLFPFQKETIGSVVYVFALLVEHEHFLRAWALVAVDEVCAVGQQLAVAFADRWDNLDGAAGHVDDAHVGVDVGAAEVDAVANGEHGERRHCLQTFNAGWVDVDHVGRFRLEAEALRLHGVTVGCARLNFVEVVVGVLHIVGGE